VYKGNSLLGQYFRHGRKQFFRTQDQIIRIESKEKWFKEPHYRIINELTGAIIGKYIIPWVYNDTFHHYPEVPYTNPYLKIILHDMEYEFRRSDLKQIIGCLTRIPGEIMPLLCMTGNACAVKYAFKVDGSILSSYSALEGNIEAEENNLLLLIAGLFLLEVFFDGRNSSE
jgi:hypothetical protein